MALCSALPFVQVTGTVGSTDALKRLRNGFTHFADSHDLSAAAKSVEGLLFCAGDKGV